MYPTIVPMTETSRPPRPTARAIVESVDSIDRLNVQPWVCQRIGRSVKESLDSFSGARETETLMGDRKWQRVYLASKGTFASYVEACSCLVGSAIELLADEALPILEWNFRKMRP